MKRGLHEASVVEIRLVEGEQYGSWLFTTVTKPDGWGENWKIVHIPSGLSFVGITSQNTELDYLKIDKDAARQLAQRLSSDPSFALLLPQSLDEGWALCQRNNSEETGELRERLKAICNAIKEKVA